jgi:EmrB/QacA subfamily drug resistance transporter
MTSRAGLAPEAARSTVQTASSGKPQIEELRWLMLLVLLTSMFMAQFDLYVVNIAAPTLERDIHTGPAALELIVAGYGFTYASGLITGGRLGDLLGSRKMFLYGTLAFTLTSLFCGLAQSSTELVIARLLQGLAGAAMVPQVLALITAVFPTAERPRALAWFGVVTGVGAVAGQILGGALLEVDVLGLGWRIIFLVNVPIGLFTVAFGRRLLPDRKSDAKAKLDLVGAVAVSLSLALVLGPLALGQAEGWPVWTWICLVASVPAMALTLRYQKILAQRGGQPLLDVALFKDRAFSQGLVICLGIFSAFFSLMFTLTLVLQSGLGLSPLKAGITFTPLGLAYSVASIAVRRLTFKHGARLITLGTTLAGLGMLTLFAILRASGADMNAARLIGPLIIVGIGNGIAIPAVIGAVLAGAKTQTAGAAAGVLTTAQQFSSAAGVAVLGAVFFQVLGNEHRATAYSSALSWVTGIDVALLGTAIGMSLFLPRPATRQIADGAPASAAQGKPTRSQFGGASTHTETSAPGATASGACGHPLTRAPVVP